MTQRDARSGRRPVVVSLAPTILSVTVAMTVLVPAGATRAGDDPHADVVIGYIEGVGATAGYTDAATALGAPERLTGEVFAIPSVVSVFNPPFGTDEIVSIGVGGSLTLRFDTPISDDPDNLYGIDVIVFGNTGFIDAAWPDGIVGSGYFGADGGAVEVSTDGVLWVTVSGTAADGPHPTVGYADAGPYDEVPGLVATDFTRPVDPALELGHFTGLDNDAVLGLYRGSGGGLGIDLSGTGLASVGYVRIVNSARATTPIEVDAVADVSPRSPGDVNLDGTVDVIDLLDLLAAWGPAVPGGVPADFDGDGMIGVTDLLTLLAGWTT